MKKLRVKWTFDPEQDKKFMEALEEEEQNDSDICGWTGKPHVREEYDGLAIFNSDGSKPKVYKVSNGHISWYEISRPQRCGHNDADGEA